MQYTVTYRTRSGELTNEVYEADNRDALFSVLNGKGISAVRVSEGTVKKNKCYNRSFKRTIFAVIVIILFLLGLIIYYLCDHKVNHIKPSSSVPSKISEYTPSIKETQESKQDPVGVVDLSYRPKEAFEKANGYVRLPSGRLHRMSAHVLTNTVASIHPPSKYEIFDHHVENQIAALLTLNPGETLVGTPRYGDAFVSQFLKSLESPIVITSSDDEYAANLKRAMIETKKDLKYRYDAGEDIAQIMRDTHTEFQKLSVARQLMLEEFSKLNHNSEATADDIDDFIKAANLVLEKKGIAPLESNPVVNRMIQLRKVSLDSNLKGNN